MARRCVPYLLIGIDVPLLLVHTLLIQFTTQLRHDAALIHRSCPFLFLLWKSRGWLLYVPHWAICLRRSSQNIRLADLVPGVQLKNPVRALREKTPWNSTCSASTTSLPGTSVGGCRTIVCIVTIVRRHRQRLIEVSHFNMRITADFPECSAPLHDLEIAAYQLNRHCQPVDLCNDKIKCSGGSQIR